MPNHLKGISFLFDVKVLVPDNLSKDRVDLNKIAKKNPAKAGRKLSGSFA